MILKEVSAYAADVTCLIEQLNRHNLSHYPPEVCHLDPPEVLARDNCTVIGAYETTPDNSVLCGIGAVKIFTDYGEIKRMYVPEEFRGQGIAKLILNRLLEITIEQNIRCVKLETGAKFEPAVKLYEKNGFTVCEAFGDYEKNPCNLYLQKKLS